MNTVKPKALTNIEEAIKNIAIDYIAHYIKGFHIDEINNIKNSFICLEKERIGEISLDELIHIAYSLRDYLELFKEPFIEYESQIFEWKNDEGVSFRMIINQHKNETTMAFYSDRNTKAKMEFKNPKVRDFYQRLELNQKIERLLKIAQKHTHKRNEILKELSTLFQNRKIKLTQFQEKFNLLKGQDYEC